jgi:hypothetical protein
MVRNKGWKPMRQSENRLPGPGEQKPARAEAVQSTNERCAEEKEEGSRERRWSSLKKKRESYSIK